MTIFYSNFPDFDIFLEDGCIYWVFIFIKALHFILFNYF